jgi:hypothetical protein
VPRGREHDEITARFLGWNLAGVHRSMDWAVRVIGPGHQVVMHGRAAVQAMELLYGRPGRVIACMHVLEDLRIIR